jgi:ketosteroid isomerase-like protein
LGVTAKLEANKEIVRRFFSLCESDGFAAAGALVADDVIWWNAGFGEMTKESYNALAVGSEALIRGGRYRFTIQSLTAEEDRVSAIVDGHSTRTTGVAYNNNYHFLFTIRDGIIVAIREYHDTRYAAEVWSDFSSMGD